MKIDESEEGMGKGRECIRVMIMNSITMMCIRMGKLKTNNNNKKQGEKGSRAYVCVGACGWMDVQCVQEHSKCGTSVVEES